MDKISGINYCNIKQKQLDLIACGFLQNDPDCLKRHYSIPQHEVLINPDPFITHFIKFYYICLFIEIKACVPVSVSK